MNINKVLKVEKYALDILKIVGGKSSRKYREFMSDAKRPTNYIPIEIAGLPLTRGVLEVNGNKILYVNGFNYSYNIVDKFPFIVFVPALLISDERRGYTTSYRITVGHSVRESTFVYNYNYCSDLVCIDCNSLYSYSLGTVNTSKEYIEKVFDYLNSNSFGKALHPAEDTIRDVTNLVNRSVFNFITNDSKESKEFDYDKCFKLYSKLISSPRSKPFAVRDYDVLVGLHTILPKDIDSMGSFLAQFSSVINHVFRDDTKTFIRHYINRELDLLSKSDGIVDNPDI